MLILSAILAFWLNAQTVVVQWQQPAAGDVCIQRLPLEGGSVLLRCSTVDAGPQRATFGPHPSRDAATVIRPGDRLCVTQLSNGTTQCSAPLGLPARVWLPVVRR